MSVFLLKVHPVDGAFQVIEGIMQQFASAVGK